MFARLYLHVLIWLIVLSLAVMVAVTFASTAIRFLVPGMGGIYWAEEITRYVSVWMVFLAAALGIRYGVHLHVDLVIAALPPNVRRAASVLICALVMSFEGVLVYFGTIVTISNMDQQSSSLLIPMGYFYAAIPVGGFLMLCETIRALVRTLAGKTPEKIPTATEL